MAAVGAVVGHLLLGGLLGFAVFAVGLLAVLPLQGILGPAEGETRSPWIQVWTFEEAAPGSADGEGLVDAVAERGLTVRWIFEERHGRLALDCGERCFEEPLDGFPAFAAIFREHGYFLHREFETVPDYRGGLGSGWAGNLLALTWYDAAPFVGLLLLTLALRRRPSWERTEDVPPRLSSGRAIGAGVAIGALVVVLEAASREITGWLGVEATALAAMFVTSGGEPLAASGGFGLALVLVATVVLVPVAEELFFRGWAVDYLEQRAGVVTACFGSAAVWAAAHVDLSRLPILLVTGLLLAWAYRRWGTLLVPIAAHATANAVSILVVRLTTPPF